jgi:uncharacterized membrane protein
MNSVSISAILSTLLLIAYYFSTFREETENESYFQLFISVISFLIMYISTFILIFNIIEIYKSLNMSEIQSTSDAPSLMRVPSLRTRQDTFARMLARRAPDPDNIIDPLFDRSPQFLQGPFGPNNPRSNQIYYTFLRN